MYVRLITFLYSFYTGALSLQNGIVKSTSGVIGIGGGSVQMTFEPTSSVERKTSTLQPSEGAVLPTDDLVDVQLYEHSKTVYTHR